MSRLVSVRFPWGPRKCHYPHEPIAFELKSSDVSPILTEEQEKLRSVSPYSISPEASVQEHPRRSLGSGFLLLRRLASWLWPTHWPSWTRQHAITPDVILAQIQEYRLVHVSAFVPGCQDPCLQCGSARDRAVTAPATPTATAVPGCGVGIKWSAHFKLRASRRKPTRAPETTIAVGPVLSSICWSTSRHSARHSVHSIPVTLAILVKTRTRPAQCRSVPLPPVGAVYALVFEHTSQRQTKTSARGPLPREEHLCAGCARATTE